MVAYNNNSWANQSVKAEVSDVWLTWEHHKGSVLDQADDQCPGSDAEDLPGGKVYSIIDLEVKPSGHGTLGKKTKQKKPKET